MISEPKRGGPKAVIQSVLMVLGLLSLAIPIKMISEKVGQFSEERAETHPAAAKALPAEWKRTVDELKGFVEDARGLKFKHDVPVVLESEREFTSRLESEDTYIQPSAADSYVALKALNLVDRSLKLDSLEDPLQMGGTLGYYDPWSNRLVVQGTDPTPFVRMILVHELTHALQDQHFNLNQELNPYDEAGLAFQALVEGDATRIENLYLASLSPDEQSQANGEMSVPDELPSPATPGPEGTKASSLDVLGMLAGFPYEVGERFATEVVASGGQARLDKAFLSPPTTTEQVLHSDRYLVLQRPVAIDLPKSQGRVIEEGVWGERGLLTMLLNTLPEDQALAAADGWAGDSYVAWRKAGNYCVQISLRTDSKADKDQLFQALRAWSLQQPAATVESGQTIRIRSCTAGIAKGSIPGTSSQT